MIWSALWFERNPFYTTWKEVRIMKLKTAANKLCKHHVVLGETIGVRIKIKSSIISVTN